MTTMVSTLCRLAVVVLVCAPGLTTSSYPVFGTKRYGRSTSLPRRRVSAWGVPAAPLAVQRSPAHYYPSEGVVSYPYAQEYVDDYYYYPQDYPYYPAAYSPAVSYYHQRPSYAYYSYDEASDPVDDLQEEMQEEEREERGESLPIGQETWFETGSRRQQAHRDSFADVNAAFLQNLMLGQTYEEAAPRRQQAARYGAYDDAEEEDEEEEDAVTAYDEDGDWTYGSVREGVPYDAYYPVEDPEDEEVRELKSLAKKARRQGLYRWTAEDAYRKRSGAKTQQQQQQQRGEFATWVPAAGGPITFTDRKVGARSTPAPAATATTTAAPRTTAPTVSPQVEARRGQKEVPLLRPPTPVRRPAVQTRSHPSSVYDTIKQLLSMENDLRKQKPASSRPHKRFVTPDEALVKELSGLKKLAV